MKTLKYFIMSLLITLIVSYSAIAQGLGEPYNPETANGANYIHSTGHRLLWQNPDSTVFNIVYFSEDSSLVAQLDPSVVLYDGTPSTVYNIIALDSVEPLYWDHKYFWRVVEFYDSHFVASSVWSFNTMPDPFFEEEIFFDDFEAGLSNWTITNEGGTCVWGVYSPPYPNSYTLRCNPNCNNVLAADADECGSGTTTITTATLDEFIDVTNATSVTLHWDNDFREVSGNLDEAHVEVSTNGGSNWQTVVSWIDEDRRNSYEFHNITNLVLGTMFKIRFRTILDGWNWWWVVDNVRVTKSYTLTEYYPPYNLFLNTISNPAPRVELKWFKGGNYTEDFLILRKNGLPTDTTNYELIGQVQFADTSFIDLTVKKNHIYTYRIMLDIFSSNEATAYVNVIIPVELINFTAYVNNNNIYLEWTTATETNNHGFEIQWFNDDLEEGYWQSIGFIPGHGTTTKQQHYSFVDESVSSGKYQYQLKQIDYDGTFEYSDIVEVVVGLPTKFTLEQNYPNPFNPSTKIKFTISDLRFTSLMVYDVLGNEVATLVNEELPAGSYEVEFSAIGGSASGGDAWDLTSGVYFYQLKTGDFSEIKKMILLK